MHLVVIVDHVLRLEIVAHHVATVLRAMANAVLSRRVAMHLVVIAGHVRHSAIAALRVVTVLRGTVNAVPSARVTTRPVAQAAIVRPARRSTIAAHRVVQVPTEAPAHHMATAARRPAIARLVPANAARSSPVKIPAARQAIARRARRSVTPAHLAASATTRTMAARFRPPSIASVRQAIVPTQNARHRRNASVTSANPHANQRPNPLNPAMQTRRPHRPASRAKVKTGSCVCRK
jgi:hypothetical protein